MILYNSYHLSHSYIYIHHMHSYLLDYWPELLTNLLLNSIIQDFYWIIILVDVTGFNMLVPAPIPTWHEAYYVIFREIVTWKTGDLTTCIDFHPPEFAPAIAPAFLASSFIFSQATVKAMRLRRSTPLAATTAYLSWCIWIIAMTFSWRRILWIKGVHLTSRVCLTGAAGVQERGGGARPYSEAASNWKNEVCPIWAITSFVSDFLTSSFILRENLPLACHTSSFWSFVTYRLK